MKFTDLNLQSELQQSLNDANYYECTPVQEHVLKIALSIKDEKHNSENQQLEKKTGVDLYVQSQTGTGKTAAYLVCILQHLASNPTLKGKKALIMVPTRELAVQVEEEAKKLSKNMNLFVASFYGGVGYNRQEAQLKRGVDILVGTPGRVIDLHKSGAMDLSQVAFLVIDEADRMFDMGFYPDLRTLINFLPDEKVRHTMLFSATLNTLVKNLAWEYTSNAKEITIECENITVDEIKQELFHVSSDDKMRLLLGILKNEKPDSIIIFCNTKHMSEIVSKRLSMNGLESEYIIGDLPQSKRLQVIEAFKRGSLKCLVATDVAARGIDVNDLAMVVNYDLPNEAENYVHRIGRTARAGKTGKAYSFCSEQDVYNLPAVERYIENKIPSSVALEDMYAEDKSAGVYIRTENHHENESQNAKVSRERKSENRDFNKNRRNSFDKKRDRPQNEKYRDRPVNGVRPQTSRKSSNSKFAEKQTKYRDRPQNEKYRDRPINGDRPRKSYYPSENDMSSLSLEQRMEIYKKKYGKSASSNQNVLKNSVNNKSKKMNPIKKFFIHLFGGKNDNSK